MSVFSCLVALSIAVLAAAAAAAPLDNTYEYRISWNGIPAAYASVAVTDDTATLRLRARVSTNALVDLLWSLRAEALGDVDTTTLQLQRFEFDRRIRGRPELTTVETGTNGVLVGRYTRPGRARFLEVAEPGIRDPISAIVQALRQLPDPGHPQVYDVFTGESRYRVALRNEGPDTVTVPAGRFDAFRLEPGIWRLDLGKPDTRVRRLTMWVTMTPPHTPLRIRSEVFIGAVYCDLVEVTSR